MCGQLGEMKDKLAALAKARVEVWACTLSAKVVEYTTKLRVWRAGNRGVAVATEDHTHSKEGASCAVSM